MPQLVLRWAVALHTFVTSMLEKPRSLSSPHIPSKFSLILGSIQDLNQAKIDFILRMGCSLKAGGCVEDPAPNQAKRAFQLTALTCDMRVLIWALSYSGQASQPLPAELIHFVQLNIHWVGERGCITRVSKQGRNQSN